MQIENTFNLISEESQFQPGLQGYLRAHFPPRTDYFVLAIIGTQSSGKSTLLNRLFGTRFQTMDSASERTRTTRGIWMSCAAEGLVLDLEGSDSTQREEEKHNFENQIALFGLAVAHGLLINVWTNQVGRYEATQYRIIKTIMEINLKLFRQESPKLILFVLRDFTDQDSEADLKDTILADLNKIWKGIPKPKDLAALDYEALFRVEFFPLRHYVYEQDQFCKGVEQLGLRLGRGEQSYFRKEDFAANLPTDSLEAYFRNVWKTIRQNKDLNLPSEKSMIYNLRCKEAKEEVMASARKQLAQLRKKAESERVDGLAWRREKQIEESLKQYKELTFSYKGSLRQTILKEIQEELQSEFQHLFEINLSLVTSRLTGDYSARLEALRVKCQGGDPQSTDFYAETVFVFDQFYSNVKKYVEMGCADQGKRNSLLKGLHKKFCLLLAEQKDKYAERCREAIVKKSVAKLLACVEAEIQNVDVHFWGTVGVEYNMQLAASEAVEKRVVQLVYGRDSPQSREQSFLFTLFYEQAVSGFKDVVSKYLVESLCRSFHNEFIKEGGVVRDFKIMLPEDTDKLYFTLRAKYQQLLDEFRHMPVSPRYDHPDSAESGDNELLSAVAMGQARASLEEQFVTSYEYAIYLDRSAMGSVPLWLWVLLAFFSYDDLLGLSDYPLLYYPTLYLMLTFALFFAFGMEDIPIALAEELLQYIHSKGPFRSK